MKDFVRIQSTKNIEVYPGLQHIDMTNPEEHASVRMKVAATWATSRIMLLEGIHDYPAVVKTWHSVQALAKSKIITIGDEMETTDEERAHELLKKVQLATARYKATVAETEKDPQIKRSRRVAAEVTPE